MLGFSRMYQLGKMVLIPKFTRITSVRALLGRLVSLVSMWPIQSVELAYVDRGPKLSLAVRSESSVCDDSWGRLTLLSVPIQPLICAYY